MTASPTTFADLPPELRIKIWHFALPSLPKPTLYTHSKEWWQPYHAYDDLLKGTELHLGYKPSHISGGRISIPLVFVNHEARSLVRSWMRQHNIYIKGPFSSFPKGQLHTSLFFYRSFDPSIDALYVPKGAVREFIVGSTRGELYRTHRRGIIDVKRVAFSEAMFYQGSRSGGILEPIGPLIVKSATRWWRIWEILILLDSPWNFVTSSISYSGDAKTHAECEVEYIEGLSFVWDSKHGQFELDGSGCVVDGDLQGRVQRIADSLIRKPVSLQYKQKLKIKGVLAVKI